MLAEGIDYYINDDGNFVFTKHYHLTRGYCCKNKCLHCPWDYGKPNKPDGQQAASGPDEADND